MRKNNEENEEENEGNQNEENGERDAGDNGEDKEKVKRIRKGATCMMTCMRRKMKAIQNEMYDLGGGPNQKE